jgi:hypothetical protein
MNVEVTEPISEIPAEERTEVLGAKVYWAGAAGDYRRAEAAWAGFSVHSGPPDRKLTIRRASRIITTMDASTADWQDGVKDPSAVLGARPACRLRRLALVSGKHYFPLWGVFEAHSGSWSGVKIQPLSLQ